VNLGLCTTLLNFVLTGALELFGLTSLAGGLFDESDPGEELDDDESSLVGDELPDASCEGLFESSEDEDGELLLDDESEDGEELSF
jgi:hypothetical protein